MCTLEKSNCFYIYRRNRILTADDIDTTGHSWLSKIHTGRLANNYICGVLFEVFESIRRLHDRKCVSQCIRLFVCTKEDYLEVHDIMVISFKQIRQERSYGLLSYPKFLTFTPVRYVSIYYRVYGVYRYEYIKILDLNRQKRIINISICRYIGTIKT